MKAAKKQTAAVCDTQMGYEGSSISSQESDSDSFDDVNEFNELSELPIEPKRHGSFLNYHDEQRLMDRMADYTPLMTMTDLDRNSAHNLPHFS